MRIYGDFSLKRLGVRPILLARPYAKALPCGAIPVGRSMLNYKLIGMNGMSIIDNLHKIDSRGN